MSGAAQHGLPETAAVDKVEILVREVGDRATTRVANAPAQEAELLPGSPAIEAGNPSGCIDSQGHLLKTDQRGQPLVDKEDKLGCNIGAYERQSDYPAASFLEG